jgi:para-nitrobenzyl esterase
VIDSLGTVPAVVTRTAYGDLEGRLEAGIAVFRGVPYAEAPVGPLRWCSPRPPRPWTGVRRAAVHSAPFVQSADAGSAEDALYANIWSPDVTGRAPVLVYIHGGGWQVGAGSVPTFDGARLAAAGGLVVVNFNYRLAGFGWGMHEELADPETGHRANWGLQDQAALLEWVRENVGAFGGDAENITLCGTSAGGATAWLLALRARARGIKRLIAISAPYAAAPAAALTPEDSRRVYASIAGEFGGGVAGLREVPYRAFHEAWLRAFAGDPAGSGRLVASGREYRGPVLDGATVPAYAHQAPTLEVPVMSIHNATEGSFFTDPLSPSFPPAPPAPVDGPGLVRAVRGVLGKLGPNPVEGLAEACVAAYRAAAENEGLPADPRTLWTEVWGDALFRCPIVRLAERHEREGATPGYVMHFAHPTRAPHFGTPHDATSKFLFGTHGHPANAAQFGDGPAEREVSRLFMEYVAAFARGGVPRAAGAPAWPPFTVSGPSTLILGGPGTARIGDVPKRSQLRFWDRTDLIARP